MLRYRHFPEYATAPDASPLHPLASDRTLLNVTWQISHLDFSARYTVSSASLRRASSSERNDHRRSRSVSERSLRRASDSMLLESDIYATLW